MNKRQQLELARREYEIKYREFTIDMMELADKYYGHGNWIVEKYYSYGTWIVEEDDFHSDFYVTINIAVASFLGPHKFRKKEDIQNAINSEINDTKLYYKNKAIQDALQAEYDALDKTQPATMRFFELRDEMYKVCYPSVMRDENGNLIK